MFSFSFCVLFFFFFFFFFSSRRRHTRLTCDWSSDVCSSDLPFVEDRPQTLLLRLVNGRATLPRDRFDQRDDFLFDAHTKIVGVERVKIGRASCRERV